MSFLPRAIKSIRAYSITIASGPGSATVAITSVDTAYSYLRIVKVSAGGSTVSRFGRIALTSSVLVTLFTTEAMTLYFEVVEYYPIFIKSINSYTVAVTPATGNTSVVVVTAVDLASSYVEYNGAQITTITSSGQTEDETIVELRLTAVNNVTLVRAQSLNNSITFGFTVIEFRN